MDAVRPESVGLSSERLKRVDAVLRRYVDEGKIAGALAMVARRARVAYAQCVGMMDIQASKAMRFDTLFRIQSMTKPITSVALMMLYEEGYFQLQTPVSRFIPEFANAKVLLGGDESNPELADLEQEITLWHLLTHTSGLSYGDDGNDPLDRMYQHRIHPIREQRSGVTLEQLVQELTRLPLAYQPGSAWRYSMATDVVGYLVQVISGIPFDEFLKQRILEPLEMHDTDFYVPQAKTERLSAVYGPSENGGLKVIDEPATSSYAQPTSCPLGARGLVSTGPDYLRFAQMLLNMGELEGRRLLGRKTVELMTLNHLPDGVHPYGLPAMGFGLGFGLCIDAARAHILTSLGSYFWGGAYSTSFRVDPKEELIGLLLLQFEPQGPFCPIRPDFRVAVYQSIVD